MKRTTLLSFALIAISGLASATQITYIFNTGTGIVTGGPSFPAGNPSAASDSTGHSLGVTVLNLASPASSSVAAATLTGSGTLFCASQTGTTCASTATSEVSTAAGHASGLGVGNGRLDGGETFIIQILAGYTAKLVQFQTTALIGNATPSDQETGFYNIGAGNVSFSGSNNAVDTFNLASLSFTTLTFGVPSGGPNGGNTYALQSLTLDITPTGAVPEPGSMALMGSGLVALGMLARRRKNQNS